MTRAHHESDLKKINCGKGTATYYESWPRYYCPASARSCAPNALRVPVGDRVVVRATRKLLKAEEVTVSYLRPDLAFAPLKERRAYLEGVYGFKCQCYRCKVC